MKRSLAVLLVSFMAMGLFPVKVTAEEKTDYNSPNCWIAFESYVGLGEEGGGNIFIRDESPFKDDEIIPEDFIITSSLTGQVEITEVFNKTEYFDNEYQDYVVTYRIKFKGTVLGNCYVQLGSCAVSDEAGNCNWPSQSVGVTVGLVTTERPDIYDIGKRIPLLLVQTVLVPFNFLKEFFWIIF